MKTNTKLFAVLFSSLIGCVVSSVATASTTFSDSTFNLSDYSISTYQTSGVENTVSQTSSGNPGPALQIQVHIPRTFESTFHASQAIINTTFRYDPSIQGAIDSLEQSLDWRGVVVQNGVSVPYSPVGTQIGGLLLIRQDGHSYVPLSRDTGSSIVGGETFSHAHFFDLKASDFGLVTDPLSRSIDSTQHPSFTSGVLEFGLPLGFSGTNLFGFPETNATATIDNLSITVSSVPEPETYAMLLAGLGVVSFLGRRKNRSRSEPQFS
jgi:hypothetical protein